MRNSKGGFTMVELIIVIAIMGVLLSVIGMSVSAVFSSRARHSAAEIDAYISMCKINSMSRAGDIRIVLDVDGDGCIRGRYYESGALKDTAVLSGRGVTAEVTINGAQETLSKDHPLTLSFDRSTGGFKPQDAGGDVYCTAIRVSYGKTYVITLVPATGGHLVSAEAAA